MQTVTLYGTTSAVASGKLLYPVEMSVGSLSYARDLLRVARENILVSYPILDPCSLALRNAYAYLATARYVKVPLQQASCNAVWHCRPFLPLAI